MFSIVLLSVKLNRVDGPHHPHFSSANKALSLLVVLIEPKVWGLSQKLYRLKKPGGFWYFLVTDVISSTKNYQSCCKIF